MPNIINLALDRKQPIQKFFFDQLAICELPNARENAIASSAKRTNRGEPVKVRTTFVKIYLPKKGCSIVNITSGDILLKEILNMVTRKRALATGQHTLELVDAPGVELDLNQTLQSLNRLEFNLIHKFSKRVDLNEEEGDQSRDDIQMSWKLNQYKVGNNNSFVSCMQTGNQYLGNSNFALCLFSNIW